MKKRSRFFIAAIGIFFPVLVGLLLPFDFSYYGLALGIFCAFVLTWWALGFGINNQVWERMVYLILPGIFLVGYYLFFSILPISIVATFAISVLFSALFYILLRLENIFLVTFENKTVPLYRAAYTVGLLMMLISSFFMYNALYSYRLPFYLNAVGVWIISMFCMGFQVWSVLAEQGSVSRREVFNYVSIVSLVLSQVAVMFSFWPLGVILSSVCLVSVEYVLSSILEPELRGRNAINAWNNMRWVVIAAIIGIILFIPWR